MGMGGDAQAQSAATTLDDARQRFLSQAFSVCYHMTCGRLYASPADDPYRFCPYCGVEVRETGRIDTDD